MEGEELDRPLPPKKGGERGEEFLCVKKLPFFK